MKKFISLVKANMSEGMNIFKVNTKKPNNFTQKVLPIIIAILVMISIYFYAEKVITKLQPINKEFILITLFIVITSFVTIIGGIYKAGNLLFKCKDDNLLFSLPIKKKMVLAIRILKFYLYELIYNSVFLIPAIICYVIHTRPNLTFYIVTIIGILVFPIIPILISCLIGTLITAVASKFKGKNIAQTVFSFIIFIGIFYMTNNADQLLINLANNALSVNDFITKVYYPAGAYNELILNFNTLKLFEFIGIHLVLLIITILLISKSYFKINSNTIAIKTKKSNKEYNIKKLSPISSLIKKEFNKFINSPVFFTNAALGVLFVIAGCILLVVKFDSIETLIPQMNLTATIQETKSFISLIYFGLICFSGCLASITSSMISLEGRAINILKTMPVKPYTIIKSKILTALLIKIPVVFIGNIIVFIRFKFDIVSMILIIIASVIIPLVIETIGIMVNLKYPRMDAQSDTEVVKQSMSSFISALTGIGLLFLTIFLIYKLVMADISINLIMLSIISMYGVMYAILSTILHKTVDRNFNNIVA